MSLILFEDTPTPAYDLNFMVGSLPAGLTYTNSSVTRTYFGSDGLLKTAAANEPIFEYNPVTLALLGMRWEMEQRTNLLLQSILPGGGAVPTGWTQPIATGSSAPSTSTYGNADGSVAYLHSATAQRPLFSQNVSLSANTTYSLSMLVESVSGGLIAADCIAINSPPVGAVLTYPVCPANPSGGPAGVLTTGELRIQIAVAATAGTVGARIGIGCNGNATGTMKFSRPQFEAGTSRSSFIPTAGSAVIRQPDVLTATSISPWYRQDEGTVVFEGIADYLTISLMGIFAFSDGTGANRITQYIDSTGSINALNATAGVNVDTSFTANTITAGSVFRSAHAYKLDNFGTVLNAGTVVTDTSGAPATITQLRLGARTSAGTSPFMGYARRFQYYNTRLPNSQIQGLSRV